MTNVSPTIINDFMEVFVPTKVRVHNDWHFFQYVLVEVEKKMVEKRKKEIKAMIMEG